MIFILFRNFEDTKLQSIQIPYNFEKKLSEVDIFESMQIFVVTKIFLILSFNEIFYLSASSNCELFEWANIINEEIHQTKFVTESNQHKQTRWMQCNTVSFFLKHLV